MAFIYNLTDSWTDAATTWNGIKLAVTNTASSASSNLLNLTVTGATTASFVVDKSGNLALNGTVNKITMTAPATGATLTLADNSTFITSGAYSSTFTFSGTTTLTFPTSGTVTALGNTTTGSGAIVLASSPTLVTPALGTPSSGTLTNCTGFPASGLSGLGAGVATWLGTPSSANLAAAVTDETGSGSLVFATSPTLVSPALGTPTSVNLTYGTNLPISTGVDGLGTGVATFLATPTSANLAAAVTDETGSGPLVFATSPTFTSQVTLGTASSTRGTLVLSNTSANTVTLQSSNSTAANYTLTFPAAAPVNGYYLQTDSFGQLSWAAGGGGGGGGSPGGSDTQVQYNNAGAFGGMPGFTFDGTATVSMGVASTTSGSLKLYNSASANSVSIASGNNSAAWTMTLPPDDGSANQFLQTDGSGNTIWAAAAAGTINTGTIGQITYYSGANALSGTTTGTGVLTALGVNTGSAGAFVVNGGALGTPSSGTLSSCTGLSLTTGVSGILPVANGGTNASSAGITAFNNITGYTATGATGTTSTNLVFSTSPTLVTPVLGAATATSINGLTITSSTGTLTITNAKTLSVSNTLTLAGTDSTTMTFPATSSTVLTTGNTATITKGYTVTPNNIGTVSSGTTTPDPANGNYQYYTNNGAHTLAAPSSDCAIDILLTNGASAGAITFSGFTVGSSTGSTYATTNTQKYILSIRRINGTSTYSWYALQ